MTFKGEGRRKLERARREPKLERRVQLLEDALEETLQELERVMENLGPENFGAEVRVKMKGGQ